MAQASTTVLIKGDNADLRRALKQSESGMRRFGVSVKAAGAALLSAFAIRELFTGARNSIAAAIEQEKAEAKVAAVIRATGAAAGFTSSQLNILASDLQKVTTTGDEQILSMVAMLLSFKSIGKEAGVFKRAIEAALDLEAAGFGNAESNILQLGKALEDPIRGITALRRSGVSFTKEQEAGFKTLVEEGNKQAAQLLLLDAIFEQVGGTATALAKTQGGQLQQLTNEWGDLKETIGRSLVKPLTAAIPLLRAMVQEGEIFADAFESGFTADDLVRNFTKASDAVLDFFDVLGANIGVLSTAWDKALKGMGLAVIDLLLQPLQQVSTFISDIMIDNLGTFVDLIDKLPAVDVDALGFRRLAGNAQAEIAKIQGSIDAFRLSVAEGAATNLEEFTAIQDAALLEVARRINARREARLRNVTDDVDEVINGPRGLIPTAEKAGEKFNKAAFRTESLDALTKRLIANASQPGEVLKQQVARNIAFDDSPVAAPVPGRGAGSPDARLADLETRLRNAVIGSQEHQQLSDKIFTRIAEAAEQTAKNTEEGGGLG